MATPAPDLHALLSPGRVLLLPPGTGRLAILERLASLTMDDLGSSLSEIFLRAMLVREDLATTAIGGGVALPHARLPGLASCRLTLARSSDGIEYGARDGMPVRLFAAIAAREEDRSEHLRVLAAVAARLGDPARRERLIAAPGADELRAAFLA